MAKLKQKWRGSFNYNRMPVIEYCCIAKGRLFSPELADIFDEIDIKKNILEFLAG